jgi:hypothetical protein
MKTYNHYIKLALVCTVILLTFTHPLLHSNAQNDDNTLLTILENVPQEHVFPQMAAMTLTYAHYRSIEQANGVVPIKSRDEYLALTEQERNLWQMSLLRIYAGPHNYANLTQEKINSMPEVIGFDFFDIDAAMVYGADPFVGTLIHSNDAPFARSQINGALRTRGFQPMEVETGVAWGKGGDGMTDINDIVLGDPFGGDVGLASRVAVLDDFTVGNSFLWGILQRSAQAQGDVAASYAELPEYQAMANALDQNDTLLQTIILSTAAAQQQQAIDEIDTLPPYILGAISDLQRDDMQIHRFTLLYDDAEFADIAAGLLPDLVTDVSGTWLDILGFEMMPVNIAENCCNTRHRGKNPHRTRCAQW